MHTHAEHRPIDVVAAVVERTGRFLVGLRPGHKRHGGLWEFPGGKTLPGETAFEAVRRELGEELGLEVTAVDKALCSLADPDSPFVIHFVPTVVQGEPVPHEHERLGWFTPDELEALPLAPSDARFVREHLSGVCEAGDSSAESARGP